MRALKLPVRKTIGSNSLVIIRDSTSGMVGRVPFLLMGGVIFDMAGLCLKHRAIYFVG